MTGRASGEARVMMVETEEDEKSPSVKRAWATTPPIECATITTAEGGRGEGEEEEEGY